MTALCSHCRLKSVPSAALIVSWIICLLTEADPIRRVLEFTESCYLWANAATRGLWEAPCRQQDTAFLHSMADQFANQLLQTTVLQFMVLQS